MAFMIIKAVGWKHLCPPIRAEPALGEKQPVAQLHENKKERKNQIRKGEPSVDTGGFLFVQDEKTFVSDFGFRY